MTNDSLAQMRADIEMLKVQVARLQPLIDDEGELSDWAKGQLVIADATPDSEYIAHEEVKRRLYARRQRPHDYYKSNRKLFKVLSTAFSYDKRVNCAAPCRY